MFYASGVHIDLENSKPRWALEIKSANENDLEIKTSI